VPFERRTEASTLGCASSDPTPLAGGGHHNLRRGKGPHFHGASYGELAGGLPGGSNLQIACGISSGSWSRKAKAEPTFRCYLL
jgi:hypothetical protein